MHHIITVCNSSSYKQEIEATANGCTSIRNNSLNNSGPVWSLLPRSHPPYLQLLLEHEWRCMAPNRVLYYKGTHNGIWRELQMPSIKANRGAFQDYKKVVVIIILANAHWHFAIIKDEIMKHTNIDFPPASVDGYIFTLAARRIDWEAWHGVRESRSRSRRDVIIEFPPGNVSPTSNEHLVGAKTKEGSTK